MEREMVVLSLVLLLKVDAIVLRRVPAALPPASAAPLRSARRAVRKERAQEELER